MLLQNIEVLLAQLKAEISILEARLKTTLVEVSKRADKAGVDMTKHTDPVPAAPAAEAPTAHAKA